MKRFLIVLALVAVAGATYAATAPGSQTAGPTAAQFRALKRVVAGLKRKVIAAQQDTDALGEFLLQCVAHAPVAAHSVGDSSNGYLFGAPGTPPASATATNALALDVSGTPTYRFFTVNQTEPICAFIINSASHRHALKRIEAFGRH